ncbi:hypothetical protein Tco_1285769 [Tanacetum coccineum]
MSAHDKNGLGYGTQLNEMSDKSETDSEISINVFEVRSSDEESTPANHRFSKADGYHDVPPPIIRNFLTPRVGISFTGLDEYAIRKKIIESKTTELNADTSKSKKNLVPLCYVIFDLEPFLLSFDFIFTSEIFKPLSFSLDRLCRLAILCLDQHAHTLHHLESLLTISLDNHCLDNLDILKEDPKYQSLWKSLSLNLELS